MAQAKGRKLGRNKDYMAARRSSMTTEFNKARRLLRHLKRGNHTRQQSCAWNALEKVAGQLFTAQRKELNVQAYLDQRGTLERTAKAWCNERRAENGKEVGA